MGAFRRRWPGLSYGRGEDWHYVGDTGEPAFADSWENTASDQNLAFRIREAGVVDIQGYVLNGDAPIAPSVNRFFTLPEEYRPSSDTSQGTAIILTDDASDGYIAAPLGVSTAGVVYVSDILADPVFSNAVPGAYSGVAVYVWIQCQFFLNPASAP